MSDFVYSFANVRRVVKKNRDQIKKKKTGWFSSEEYKVEYDTPALILTQRGAQEEDDNQYLKYDITAAMIKEFMEKNRKWFVEPEGGGDWVFDKTVTEKTEPFLLEEMVDLCAKDNMRFYDYDDEFSTAAGGLVYGVIINLTQKRVVVVFRGTVGATDIGTDRDFRLDHESLFESEDDIFIPGGKPGTHKGFTTYLCDEKKGEDDGRKVLERILSCVNEVFEENADVAGQGFDLYVTGHSLGGGLANLFSFKAAQLKAKGDERVKHLPELVIALTFAAPVVGNEDFNKEYQYLEKKGVLRHIRVSNEGDLVPTTNFIPPFSFGIKGDSSLYTQNGVNLLFHHKDEVKVEYRNTKSFGSQMGFSPLTNHKVGEYHIRVGLEVNKKAYEQTVEELYKVAGEFTD